VFREQLIARTGRENQKIGFLPIAFHAVAGLRRRSVHTHHAGTLHVAACISRAIQEHAVEHRPRIDNDRMGHLKRGAMFSLLISSTEFTSFLG